MCKCADEEENDVQISDMQMKKKTMCEFWICRCADEEENDVQISDMQMKKKNEQQFIYPHT